MGRAEERICAELCRGAGVAATPGQRRLAGREPRAPDRRCATQRTYLYLCAALERSADAGLLRHRRADGPDSGDDAHRAAGPAPDQRCQRDPFAEPATEYRCALHGRHNRDDEICGSSASFDLRLPATGARPRRRAGAAEHDAADTGAGRLGPMDLLWAGTGADQRLYSQIASGTAPNTSGCWSGCGATAWAMLFGWADNQAAIGNAYWSPRFGLYRQNGGYGVDAVAPPTMDAGVSAMTWEIRNRIGTFCAFGSGATPPWSMGGASGYLAGRTGTRLDTHYDVLVSMRIVCASTPVTRFATAGRRRSSGRAG